jgi:hypothetical protein
MPQAHELLSVAITALLTLAFETRIDAWSGRLQRPRTQPRIDNPLGLRNNFPCAIFLQLGGAIGSCTGRSWRKDSGSPTLSYGAYLYPISLVFDYCHCLPDAYNWRGSLLKSYGYCEPNGINE